MSGAPQGYEMVKDRIARFYKKYPDGRIHTSQPEFIQIAGKDMVTMRAFAYRTADDPVPGTGTVTEPIPGLTPFTRNSEVANAETSSIGRALATIGMGGHIATLDEIEAKGAKPKEVSTAAADFMQWANKEKVPAQKIKLTLGAMGVAMGNKHLKTVVASMTDEQIQMLRGKLDES